MPNYVPGVGNPNAKLLALGEAPGEVEDDEKEPFKGPAGGMFDNICKAAGIHRNEIWLTNVIKFRPPNNDFKRIEELGLNLDQCYEELEKEIRDVGPNCILALGNEALKAVTGISGISKWRGSILRSKWGPKVVGTFHPAALLYQHGEFDGLSYFWKAVMALDFKRASDESAFPEYQIPDRTLMVCRSSQELYNFLERHKDKELCAIDIETRKTIPVCIALAFSPYESMSIPLLEPNSWHESAKGINNDAEMTEIWRLLIAFFERSNLKIIGQNFKFDHEKLLKPCGFPVPDPYADTMLAMHTINPELPKSLDFIASIYTREPYYKDEGREFDLRKHPIERFFLYNAKDSAVTFEAWLELEKELKELNLEDFFHNFVMKLHPLYMHIESNGFKINEERRKELRKKYGDKLKAIDKEFEELVGYKPVTAEEQKAILKKCKKEGTEPGFIINLASPQQLSELLYGVMKLPKRASTDEDTLVALIGNHCSKDEKKKRTLELIIDRRKVRRTLDNYLSVKPDYDGRVRTAYKICGAETGRTSTTMQADEKRCVLRPEPMGTAFQTLTKHGDIGPEIREMYEPGY